MTDWIILRTAGRSTLGLSESLNKDGFEAWTPVETVTRRVPRMNARREIRLPIMPSYVFARVAHLVDLLELAAMPVKPRRGAGLMDPAHAAFRIMRCFDRIPLIADRHLDGLRRLEAKRTPRKRAAYSLQGGQSARVNGGPFQGMVGVVARSNERKTNLCFTLYGKSVSVEIPTTMLEVDEVVLRRAA